MLRRFLDNFFPDILNLGGLFTVRVILQVGPWTGQLAVTLLRPYAQRKDPVSTPKQMLCTPLVLSVLL